MVVIFSLVVTGYTTRSWGWLLGKRGYSIEHQNRYEAETAEQVAQIHDSYTMIWWWLNIFMSIEILEHLFIYQVLRTYQEI